MKRINKKVGAIICCLLFAATALLAWPAASVSAETEGVYGVHADISTFMKNYSLTAAQKKYAIQKCERIVAFVTDPEMSDLEKYYKLALWENDHATYDNEFYSDGYNFQYYRHQWDAYGTLSDTSVCVGIAILYSNICHAADLPCKFVRTSPVDHTLNYIPDINGNAYYVDITEGCFLMSKNSDSSWEESMDKAFAYITKDCTDGTFEYKLTYDDSGEYIVLPANIKANFKTRYEDWFKEYALHEGTTKEFMGEYVEKGSGTRGVHHAAYHDYPKQFSAAEKPAHKWFLEDFYENPAEIQSAILAKKFDGQLLNITWIEDSYDCKEAGELEERIRNVIDVEYFPSAENGEVVAEETKLEMDTDYTVSCTSFDKSKGKAVMKIEGMGDYSGSYEFSVNLKTDAAKKAANPVKLKGRTTAVKYSKLRKKNQIIKSAKLIKVSNAKGKLTYKYVTAKKGKKNFKKYFKINSKTGKVKVRKGLKKGTYKVKVKVRAAGNASYKASPWKTVIFKVKVK